MGITKGSLLGGGEMWTKFIEFIKISQAVAIGFAIMGFLGFIVKLIHIPINNILVWFRWC